MNILLNDISRAIFKKPIEECSIDEISRLCNQYPYFGPLHVLHASKLKAEGSSQSYSQLQKASLYFSNPLWLDYLLSEPATVLKSFNENRPANTLNNESHIEEIAVVEEVQPASGSINKKDPANDISGTNAFSEMKISEPERNKEEGKKDTANSINDKSPNPEFGNQSSIEIEEENEAPEPGAYAEPPFPKLKIESIEAGTAPLSFEPYHMVDYFASQGIKAKEEPRPVDRFSQQLKSFTEWLKTMKKIPVSELESTSNQAGEQKVEQMAALSITEREVVTEAMAEVWEKQGDKVKAMEIYRKLSLLDPSKSTYFAAKIEALK